MMLLLNPLTYIAIAASIAMLGDSSGLAALYRRLIVVISLIVLMPPLAWILDMLTGRPESAVTHSAHGERQTTS